jgi:hypothetical protein
LDAKTAPQGVTIAREFTVQALATLTVVFKEAQGMEARSLGFNYKEGRPFKTDDEEQAEKPTVLEIREMTPEQAAQIREAAEKRARRDGWRT